MEINVRKATIDDYAALCGLFDEIDDLHRSHLPQFFQKPAGAAREQDYYLKQLDDKNVVLFIAETGEQLVGFIHAVVRDTPQHTVFIPRRYASVDSIVVKSIFQNQGIGSLLMEKMQEWAISQNAASIELNVYEFNRTAIAFYESLGYQTFSRRMNKELK